MTCHLRGERAADLRDGSACKADPSSLPRFRALLPRHRDSVALLR
jgi:hypothetical protein